MAKLFSTENREVLTAPLGKDNPITIQILGICSALAVTSQLKPAIVMGLSPDSRSSNFGSNSFDAMVL